MRCGQIVVADCPSCHRALPGASAYCPFCGYSAKKDETQPVEPPKAADPVFQLWILDIDEARRDELVEYLTRVTKGKDAQQVAARLSHLPTLLFGSISLKAAESLLTSLQERGGTVEIRHLTAEAPPPPQEPSRRKPPVSASRAVRELPAEPKSRGLTWFLVITGVVLAGLIALLLVSYNRYMKSPDMPFKAFEDMTLPTPNPTPPPPEEVPPPDGEEQSSLTPPGGFVAGGLRGEGG